MLLNAAKTRCSFCCLWLLRGRRGCGRHWLLCRRILLCRRGRRAVSFGTGASLATRAAGFGLPPNRGPKASRGFTLAGTAGRAAKRLLGSCRLLFCVASGFLTAPRGDGYSSAGAASPVKVALALTVAEGARGVHIPSPASIQGVAGLGALLPPCCLLVALFFEQLQGAPCLPPLELVVGHLEDAVLC